MQSRQSGVTLIELLTVMIVLAILASIAVPTYRSYLLRANRSDAKSALLNLQAAEEKYYLQYNKYTDKVTEAPPAGLGLSGTTPHGFYEIKVTSLGGDGQSYKAEATPVAGGGQSDDTKCGTFTITDTGARDVTGPAGKDACWR